MCFSLRLVWLGCFLRLASLRGGLGKFFLFSSSGLAQFFSSSRLARWGLERGRRICCSLRLAWLGFCSSSGVAQRGLGELFFPLRLAWLGFVLRLRLVCAVGFFLCGLARLGLGFRVLLVRVCRNLFSFRGIAVCGPTAKQRPRCSGHDRGSAS